MLACLLAACSTGSVGPIEGGASYRAPNAPIGVTSRFDEARFAGPWRVREMIPEREEIDWFTLKDGPTGLQMQVQAFVCDPAGICGNFGETLRARREGEGRYLITMPGGTQRRLWVLWVDEGFRTAVIGNPEGTFAWIVDRAAKGGSDRIKAAREILDFNGYDVSQIKVNS